MKGKYIIIIIIIINTKVTFIYFIYYPSRIIIQFIEDMFDKIHCYYLHRKAEFWMFLQQFTQTYACFG